MKKLIRLTEADLHRIVKESVNKTLNEAKIINGNFSNKYFVQYLRKAYDYADEINRKRLVQVFPNIFRDTAA